MKRRRIPKETADQIAELFDREEGQLMRFASTLTAGETAQAADLVQQTFMAAALDWGTIEDRGASGQRAWLRRTCRNKWIDGLRRSGTLENLLPHLARSYEHLAPDPADIVIARVVLEQCWKTIGTLPPVRRQVSLLHWHQGYSSSEIAKLLELHPSGVRKHLSYARRALRLSVAPYLDQRLRDTADVPEEEGA
ncbi:RNA polymerase sigma factor [Streptomyces turgidiscabies]|uniref:RNA polymerase sigma factor n=1 Tax=Streptomyces TaxID=1883 RepID=UPI000305D248|nr:MULTISPECIES: RNA polymerase sigma factor [Streptomyces]MDX3500092.1 RNA polymerase sigma factor [Streptomyces turgidiscabies]